MKKVFEFFKMVDFFLIAYFILAKQRFWKYQLILWPDLKKNLEMTLRRECVIKILVRVSKFYLDTFSNYVMYGINFMLDNMWKLLFNKSLKELRMQYFKRNWVHFILLCYSNSSGIILQHSGIRVCCKHFKPVFTII